MPRLASPFALWRRPALSEQAQTQARIDSKLRAIERQGSGGVHFGHALAYLLVVTFSVGALIALAGDALRTFLTQAHQGAVDIPSLISFVVSFVLVFAMDTAMVRAAATVRMLHQRRQAGGGIHVAVIVTVCVVESATYLYMSYEYDHPTTAVVWTILAVRAIAAPVMAVYLSLGRQLPISARDINTQVEIVTGRGVLLDMTRIADDAQSTTERKVALYRASAIMDELDAQRLDAIIQAERATREQMLPAPMRQISPATQAAQASGKITSNDRSDNARARRAALLDGMFGGRAHPTTPKAALAQQREDESLDGWTDDDPDTDEDDLDWAATPDADEAADALDFYRVKQRTSVRPTRDRSTERASMSQRTGVKRSGSAARIAPRMHGEMVIDLPEGKSERAGDTPEAKRVMRYLDKNPGAKVIDVQNGAHVTKATARRYYTAWLERNKRLGETAVSFTEEMPAVTADMLH